MTGSTTKESSASFQLVQSMITTMPTRISTLLKMPVMPSPKNSLITPTSFWMPAHDRADAAAVDVADAQLLQMAEHRVADIEHHPVAEPGVQVELAPARQEADHQTGDEGDRQAGRSGSRAARPRLRRCPS